MSDDAGIALSPNCQLGEPHTDIQGLSWEEPGWPGPAIYASAKMRGTGKGDGWPSASFFPLPHLNHRASSSIIGSVS